MSAVKVPIVDLNRALQGEVGRQLPIRGFHIRAGCDQEREVFFIRANQSTSTVTTTKYGELSEFMDAVGGELVEEVPAINDIKVVRVGTIELAEGTRAVL